MKQANKWKWFWRINYAISFYIFLSLVCTGLQLGGLDTNWLNAVYKILNPIWMHYFGLYILTFQLILSVLLTIIFKRERIDFFNYLYMSLLVFTGISLIGLNMILGGVVG
ncbi:MAG: hypothetical protein EOO96_22390 [Pedobacter sp.]|nr:MAG: hypothetical protein EOO96_22390 [Pedobacter sp.]